MSMLPSLFLGAEKCHDCCKVHVQGFVVVDNVLKSIAHQGKYYADH